MGKPIWALRGDEQRRYFERRKRDREREDRRRQAVSHRFRRKLEEQYPDSIGSYRFFEDKALFHCDSCCEQLSEDKSDYGQAVLIRLLYVTRQHRNKGIALRLIRSLTEIAEQTGCCLLAVSSPFERLGDAKPKETVQEVAKDFVNSAVYVSTILGEDRYRGLQQRMGRRFQQAGFGQIDMCELIGDQNRCPPKHCWIYVPTTVDQEFHRAIKHRLIE